MTGIRPLLCFLVAAALGCVTAGAATYSGGRTVYADSVKGVAAPVPGTPRAGAMTRSALRADERSAMMTFEVALRMRGFDELQARIAAGEQIGRPEMEAKYFPLSVDHGRVLDWLRAEGLEVTRTDDNRLAVFGRGSVDAVAAAFQATFARVTDERGTEHTSAVSAPSVPVELAAAVLGIHGLQPHIRLRPLSAPPKPRAGTTITVGGFLPSQVAAAYGSSGLSATGSGQAIAIFAFAYPLSSDLTAFWSQAGVNASLANVQTIDVAGGPGASPSMESVNEASLDAEWASSLAPGATLRMYGTNETDPAYSDEILQQIFADLPANPTLHQLCICIGKNEQEVDRDSLIIQSQYMATLASAGVSILVASGDDGAKPDKIAQVTIPTSDPDVTGVGGTTLVLDGTGAVSSETAWSGSGGGDSIQFGRPAWQVGTGVPPGAMRLVPDVAAASDPQTGALVVINGNSEVIGGTSWATPVWSAFTALLNQGRPAPLGLLNPKLYPLIGTSSFRDITSGDNGLFNAGPGYDLCTGIGSPNVLALSQAILSPLAGLSIADQLGDQFATVGQAATFLVSGAGARSISYQWQRLPAGSGSFANLSDSATYSGSATAMLVVSGSTLAMAGDQFKCVVTAGSASVTSNPEKLTVGTFGVTTLAGWPGAAGRADGKGRVARFSYPGGVRADAAGNIFVTDSYNNTVRKVTPSGVVTTVAGVPGKSGSQDGPVATALLGSTAGVAVDGAGNLFVADDGNATIREVSVSGIVTTLAGMAGQTGEVDGVGSAARFTDPQNLAIDGAGNLYVADGVANVIRKVTSGGSVTTFAGSGVPGGADGSGTTAQFNFPTGVAVDAAGNVFVADAGNDTIRKITPAGVVTTVAGAAGNAGAADGTGAAASFNAPDGVGVDAAGNLYVADSANDTIREISPSGVVTTLAGSAGNPEGTDGPAPNARFVSPGDVTIDSAGIIYVADAQNQTIRRIVADQVQAPVSGSRLINVSSRALVQTGGSIAIAGFVIEGAAGTTKEVLVRGVGPGLAQFNVGGLLAAPTISVIDSAQAVVATNTGWGTGANAADVATVTAQVGAFPLAAGSADSALLANLAPGSYSVELSGVEATSGVALVEVYDADAGDPLVLANISTRAQVGTGADILIAGFVVSGTSPATVLIRGVGPTLANFGVPGFLAQPVLTVFNSANAVIASNTGWGSAPSPSQITSVSGGVGAFPLNANSADSALLLTLPPGAYSAQVSGVGGSTGIALVEVYQIMP
jgi:sugar lactone lactonase YvrE